MFMEFYGLDTPARISHPKATYSFSELNDLKINDKIQTLQPKNGPRTTNKWEYLLY